jgi:hypothetical protein
MSIHEIRRQEGKKNWNAVRPASRPIVGTLPVHSPPGGETSSLRAGSSRINRAKALPMAESAVVNDSVAIDIAPSTSRAGS